MFLASWTGAVRPAVIRQAKTRCCALHEIGVEQFGSLSQNNNPIFRWIGSDGDEAWSEFSAGGNWYANILLKGKQLGQLFNCVLVHNYARAKYVSERIYAEDFRVDCMQVVCAGAGIYCLIHLNSFALPCMMFLPNCEDKKLIYVSYNYICGMHVQYLDQFTKMV